MKHENKTSKFVEKTQRNGGFALAMALVVVAVAFALVAAGVALATHSPAKAPNANRFAVTHQAAPAIVHEASVSVKNTTSDPQEGAGQAGVSGSTGEAGSSSAADGAGTGDGATSGDSGSQAQADDQGNDEATDPSGDAGSDSADASSAGATGSSGSSSSSSADSRGDASAPADEDAATKIEKTIETADGKHFTVRVEYGDDAEIPEDAELSVVQVLKVPEGYDKRKAEFKNRPFDTERFITEKQLKERQEKLAKAVDVHDDDYVFYTEFLDIALKSGGKAVKPAAPVKVTIESDAIGAAMSDELWLSFFDDVKPGAEHADPLATENRSGDGKNDKEYEKGVKISFEADEFFELGLMGLAAPVESWQSGAYEFTAYGPDSANVWKEAAYADGLPEGAALVEAFRFGVSPDPDYGTQLFIGAKVLDGGDGDDAEQAADSVIVCYAVENGMAGERLLEGTDGKPAAVKAGDAVAIATAAPADEAVERDTDPADGDEAADEPVEQASDEPATLTGAASFLAAGSAGAHNLTMISAIRNARLSQLMPMDADGGAGDGSNPVEISYTVTWKNWNGDVLATTTVVSGAQPVVPEGASDLSKEGDAQYSYTFEGWTSSLDQGDPKTVYKATDLPAVTADVEYTASYAQSVNKYTITWKVEGSADVTEQVEYGTVPEYTGPAPSKPNDENNTYTFSHWSPTPTVVKDNETYVAIFTAAAVELCVEDYRDPHNPIAGAKFTLTNSKGTVVWTSGATPANGLLGIPRLGEGQAETENVGGAKFTPGEEYTLKQVEAGEKFFVPLGTWTIVFDESGDFTCTAHAASDDDMSTIDPRQSGIRVYIQNRPASFITYKYHYPAGEQSVQPADIRESLDFLAYRGEYVVDVADPSVGQYEFAGWQVDTFATMVKYSQKAFIDTLSVQEHTLTAQWRKPLTVQAVTYSSGDSASATLVDQSQGTFVLAEEKSKTFDGMSGFSTAYAEQNQAVWDLNGNAEFDFAFAQIKNGEAAAKTVTAIQYDATAHSWQYTTEGGGGWTNVEFGDVLTLYYSSDVVNLRWVQMQEDGSLQELNADRFPQSTGVVSSSWKSTDDLVAASDKPIVDGMSYYRYLGFGPANAQSVAELRKSDLQSFQLKNSPEGFRLRAGASGDGELLAGSNTVYVVYSETPPDGTVYLDVSNHSGNSYDLGNLYVGGTSGSNFDWIAQGKAILVGDGYLQVIDATSKVITRDQEAHIVLVGAGAKAFTIDGGFTDVADDTKMSVAVESSATVTRTTVVQDADHPKALTSTKDVTKGTLEAAPALVSVTFDSELTDLTVKKEWDEGSFPSNYSVDLTLYEGEDGGKPCAIAGKSSYALTANDGWSVIIPDVPARCEYSVVEKAVRDRSNSNADITDDFTATYSKPADNVITVSNVRSNDVCQVGGVKFKSVKAAVEYIGTLEGKTGTIEMISNYTMPESAAVVIPSGYDVTLKTVPGASSNYQIMRGFTSATDMFLVQGSLTVTGVTISGRMVSGSIMTKDGDGGLITVGTDGAAGATLTVGEGTRLEYGRANNGSAIYASSGAVVNLSGCTITNNRAISGGAVGVADSSCRINLSGATFVYDNRDGGGGGERNIYLNQDSDEVIHIVGTGLADSESTKVGVYVPDGTSKALWNAYGMPAKPFATVDETNSFVNLDKLLNDRLNGESKKGHASDLLPTKVVWGPTFSFKAKVQWLDADLAPIDAPDGAQVALKLNGGSLVPATDVAAEATLAKGDSSNWTYEFKGLAKYDGNGDPYEYRVSESQVLPADTFKQIVFTNDLGVQVSGVYDNPLTFQNKGSEEVAVVISNYKKYTEFKLTKEWGSEQSGATSNFAVHRVPKTGATLDNSSIRYAGVGGVHDLPLELRNSGVDANDGRFYTTGGNRWYVTVNGSPVQFHKFYDSAFGEFTESGGSYTLKSGQWQKGDVISPSSGTCKVYADTGWHDLGVSAKVAQLKYFNRQDGDLGVEGVGGEAVSGGSMTITGAAAETKDKLSSDYYYYAVETSVSEAGKSAAKDSHEIVALYNPVYTYDMLNQAQTVKNTRQDYLSVEKVWSDDAVNMGQCKFVVYKLQSPTDTTTAAYLATESNFRALAEKNPSTLAQDGTLAYVSEFALPIESGGAKGSWVYTEKQAPTSEPGVYFIWETTANGVPIGKPSVVETVAADAVYSYDDKVNQITVHNMSDILCKVVDSDGTEHPFRTLNEALTYGRTRTNGDSNAEFTIQMLRDYSIPESDDITINANEKITLTTASTDTSGNAYIYLYRNAAGEVDSSVTRATITRKAGNALPFVIVNGVSGNSDLTSFALENIALDGADTAPNKKSNGVTYNNGNFIYANNASIVLKKGGSPAAGVEMRNAKATNGGAIYAMASHVTVSDASFSGCVSTDSSAANVLDRGGGAIWVNGNTRVSIANSTFDKCTALRDGGAIDANNTGGVSIADCTFTDCTVSRYGGAIASANAANEETTVIGCTFTDCKAVNGNNAAYGGGVYCTGLKLTVGGAGEGEACTFSGCVAGVRGGGICYNNTAGTLEVRGCSFSECQMTATLGANNDSNGGAGVSTTANDMRITRSTFTDCRAYVRGGAIIHYNPTAEASVVEDCEITRCTTASSGGGGIANGAPVQTYRRIEFTDCVAEKSAGGGVDVGHFNLDKQSTFEDCTFTRCQAGGGAGGGAICTGARTLTATGCTFDTCKTIAASGSINGGAICMGVDSGMEELAVYGCTFKDCDVNSGNGGAIYTKGTALVLGDHPQKGTHTTFTNCSAKGHGGAVYQEITAADTKATVTNCSFGTCTSRSEWGGAIRTTAVALDITGTSFANCSSKWHGGSVAQVVSNSYVDSSYTRVSNTTFQDSTAGMQGAIAHGGALYTEAKELTAKKDGGAGSFDNCTAYGYGGAIYHTRSYETATDTIEDIDFSHCKSVSYSGGAICTTAPVVTVKRSSFAECDTGSYGGAISNDVGSDALANKSKMTIVDSSFNRVESKNGGGAIYTRAKELVVEGANGKTTFNECTAAGNGGAILQNRNLEGSKITVRNVDFKTTRSTNNAGGAIFTGAGELQIDTVTFDDSMSRSPGGAVRQQVNGSYVASTSAKVANSTFANCESTSDWAGALYIDALTLEITGEKGVKTFQNCTAAKGAGAVYHGRNWEAAVTTLVDCSFDTTSATADKGGALCTTAPKLHMTECSVDNSKSRGAGGAVCHEIDNNRLDASETLITHCTFADCQATNASAGAVYSTAKTVAVAGRSGEVTFRNCSTQTGYGGALYHNRNTTADVTTTISNCSFDSCSAGNALVSSVSYGGAVCTWATKLSVSGTKFKNVSARGNGGAICHSVNNSLLSSSSAEIENTTFANSDSLTGRGGAVWTDALEFRATGNGTSTSFSNCTSAYDGGALCLNRSNANAVAAITGCAFTLCKTTNTTSNDTRGGAVYARARKLNVDNSTFNSCSSRNNGGAIGHLPDNVYDAAGVITNSTFTNSVSTIGSGGAVYFERGDNLLKNVTIKDGKAGMNGGAVCHNWYNWNNTTKSLTLDGCTISGNEAGSCGGGVYFDSSSTITLRNGTSITDNTLGNATVGNGAGLYIFPSRQGKLVLGTNGVDDDTITVYDNKTSAGAQSNVRLTQNNKKDSKTQRYENLHHDTDLYSNSVVLLSNLSKDGYGIVGTIGVCNPGPEKTRFGMADVGERTGAENIVSDIDSMRGQLDPADLDRKILIWYAPPVCKITDVNGATLTFGGDNTAIFSRLEDAFDVVNVLTAGYLKNGDGVTPSQIQIQMLVPEYKTVGQLPVLRRSITITTAEVGNDEFHYPRNAVTKTAVIKRGDGVGGSLITVGGNVTLSVADVTLDGGSTPERQLAVPTDGGLIYGQNNAAVVLGAGAVLQNSAVGDSNSGGAVFVNGASNSGKRSLVMEKGAVIKDCAAGYGGGVFLTGGVFFDMRDDSHIETCSASQAGGAVYVSPYATMAFDNDSTWPNPIPVIAGNRITSPDGEGAGIYLASNDSKLRLQLGARARFADNVVLGTEDASRQNGYDDYPLLRQDIFLAESREPATSITLIGDMSQPAGSLWVWAKYENHYKTEMQFAVIDSDANGNPTFTPREQTLEVFRNAQDDVATENTSGSYVYGIQGDGVDIIWSYEEGANHVILKKVGDTGSGYESLEGAVFTVYKGRSTRPYIVRHDDGTRETLSGLVSGANGVFWIGKLPYGTYYLEETTVPGGYSESARWFKLDISEDGVSMSRGYANRADAG